MGETTAQPVILLRDLHKSFGSFAAVAGLSLTVSSGEIYGLLGPNGAGKTTALRVLAGLLVPQRGVVQIGGIDVTSDAQNARRRLGFLTGTAGLYARLSVREVLQHTAGLHDMTRTRTQERIQELIADLDLAEFVDKRCDSLSTGQHQRASLARTLIHDPVALILDEPTSGLDVLASQGLRSLVVREKQRGKAILMSTHYLAEAELLCDRVGFMHRGQLLCEDTPRALRDQTGAHSLEEAFLELVKRSDEARAAAPGHATAAPPPTAGSDTDAGGVLQNGDT